VISRRAKLGIAGQKCVVQFPCPANRLDEKRSRKPVQFRIRRVEHNQPILRKHASIQTSVRVGKRLAFAIALFEVVGG